MAFENNATLLTIQDSSKTAADHKNEGKKLAIWSKSGKKLLTSEDFKQIFSKINFDMVECPYDDFNESNEFKKRVRKAYDRTLNFVDSVFEKNENQTKVF